MAGESFGAQAWESVKEAAGKVQEAADTVDQGWEAQKAEWGRAIGSLVSDEIKTEHLRTDRLDDADRGTAQDFALHSIETGDAGLLADYVTAGGREIDDSIAQHRLTQAAQRILADKESRSYSDKDEPERRQTVEDMRRLFERINDPRNGLPKIIGRDENLRVFYEKQETEYKYQPPLLLAGLPKGKLEDIYYTYYADRPNGWLTTFPDSDIPPVEAVTAFAQEEAKALRDGGSLLSTNTDLLSDFGLLNNPNLQSPQMNNLFLAFSNHVAPDGNDPAQRETIDRFTRKILFHDNAGETLKDSIHAYLDSFDQEESSEQGPGGQIT